MKYLIDVVYHANALTNWKSNFPFIFSPHLPSLPRLLFPKPLHHSDRQLSPLGRWKTPILPFLSQLREPCSSRYVVLFARKLDFGHWEAQLKLGKQVSENFQLLPVDFSELPPCFWWSIFPIQINSIFVWIFSSILINYWVNDLML